MSEPTPQLCPWCQSNSPKVNRAPDYWVSCSCCGAQSPYEDTPAEAVEAWNRIQLTPPPRGAS